MISLIENYNYVNLNNEIKKLILDEFTQSQSLFINFSKLVEKIIAKIAIQNFDGLELGPFNAFIQNPKLLQISNLFLVVVKIKLLDFLKGANYIIILRDLELYKKILDNKKDLCFDNSQIKQQNFEKEEEKEKSNFLQQKSESIKLKKKISNNDFKNSSSKRIFGQLNSNNSKLNDFDFLDSGISPISKTARLKDNSGNKNDPFIPSLLHDFKNLAFDFTSLISFVIQKLPEIYKLQFKDELDDISMLKSYMFGLIKMINDFSEGNGFLINSNPKEINIIEKVNLLVRVFNKRQETENSLKGENQMKKNIKIHSKFNQIDNSLLKKLQYNNDLILSLLYNLVSNSYKSTETGQILLELKTEIMNSQDCIALYISDTGKGIPENILLSWGTPFNKDKNEKNSTGLGQFIISSIAKSLGIYIPKPESKTNFGTTFKIFFTNDTIINSNNSQFLNDDYLSSSKVSESKSINLNNFIFRENSERNTLFILMCDDSQFNLNHLELYLKKNLLYKDIEFVIKKSSNFFEFMNEINLLLKFRKIFQFLILDYNIGNNLTGLDLAKSALDFYKNSLPSFKVDDLNIFFFTEENNFYEYHKDNIIVKKEQIFNKTSIKKLKEKMIEKLRFIDNEK